MNTILISMLESELRSLDDRTNAIGLKGNYREASRISNMGRKIQVMIADLKEWNNEELSKEIPL